MNDFAELINKFGFKIFVVSALALAISFNYKKIIDWAWATIQAAAIIKSHEVTIAELKKEVQILREKLEEYNQLLIKQNEENHRLSQSQAETIARLEERLLYTAKERVK